MKKRILSFALACFMILSTVIISKPLVHIHAAETGTLATYTLPEVFGAAPEGSTDAAVSGNWSVRAWKSITDRTIVAPTATAFTDNSWSVNYLSNTFPSLDSNSGNGAKLCLNPDHGATPVIVFTAPEDGIYYFSEDVYHALWLTTAGGRPIGIDFLVYKDGVAYDSFYSAGPVPSSATLSGYVALEKGEELLFVAERVFSETIKLGTNSDAAYENGRVSGAYVEDIVVEKVAELTEDNTETVYTVDFKVDDKLYDKTVDGQFRFTGFDNATKKPLELTGQGSEVSYSKDVVTYLVGSTKHWRTRYDLGLYLSTSAPASAIVFTAPEDGYYALYADANQSYLQVKRTYNTDGSVKSDTTNYWYVEIINSNGEIIATSKSNGAQSTGTSAYYVDLATATNVFLKKDEEVYIVGRYPGTYGHNLAFESVSAVHIDNIEEQEKEWELPMDWNATGNYDSNNWELATKNQWSLTSFVDPSNITTIRNGASSATLGTGVNNKSPQSYLESRHNRGAASNVSVSTWIDWYTCTLYRWSGVHVIEAGDNAKYMNITPVIGNAMNNPSVVFTAPEDGTYSYSEFVSSTLFEKGGASVVIDATVRKNGTVIDTFTPTADDSAEILEGTVSLKKGDMLSFVFTLFSDIDLVAADKPIQLGKTVVKKIADYPEESTVKTTWTLSNNFLGEQNSYFKLKAINPKTGEYTALTYRDENCVDYQGKPIDFRWEMMNGKILLFYVLADGTKMYSGDLTDIPVVEFTAPADGIYSFDAEFVKAYGDGRNEVFSVSKGESFELYEIPAFSTNGVSGTNVLVRNNATFAGTIKLSGNVELKAGETIYFMRSLAADATKNGASAGTINYITVTANDVVCPHNWTDASGVCACGYACEHAEYADGNCVVCGVAHAEHDWSNSDGYCATCGLDHDHEGGEAVCNKGAICTICGFEYTEVAADNHDWNAETGTCTRCGTGCEHTSWMDGVCETCGYECQHTGGTATCANQAQCTACGSYYGDVDKTKHEQEGYWINNGDGTCYFYYPCCYAPTVDPDEFEAALQPHEYDDDADMTCNHCGYDRTVVVAEDNFGEVFDSIYNGGESEYVANGPAAGALDNVGAVKGTDVDGFKYMGFNLEMSADKNTFYLRHHVLLSGDLAVKVGEADAALTFVSGNYCYFDVEVKIGEFGVNHTITADGTAVVTASVYSYMKTALESGELTTEQTNLLKALYDWDYAVANAD